MIASCTNRQVGLWSDGCSGRSRGIYRKRSDNWRFCVHDRRRGDKPYRDYYYREFTDSRGELRVAGQIAGVLDGPLQVAADAVFNSMPVLDEMKGSPVTISERVNVASPEAGSDGVTCNEYYQVLNGGLLYVQYVDRVCQVRIDEQTVIVTFEEVDGPEYKTRKAAIREERDFDPRGGSGVVAWVLSRCS